MENNEAQHKGLRLCGMWRQTKNGRTFYTGNLTPTVQIVMFENDRKRSEKDPDSSLFLYRREKRQQQQPDQFAPQQQVQQQVPQQQFPQNPEPPYQQVPQQQAQPQQDPPPRQMYAQAPQEQTQAKPPQQQFPPNDYVAQQVTAASNNGDDDIPW